MKSKRYVSICLDSRNRHAFTCVGNFLKAGFVIKDLEVDTDGYTLILRLKEVFLVEPL